MADELKARLSVDASDFKAGMGEAVTVTRSSSQQMSDAMKALRVAQEQYNDSLKGGASLQKVYADALKEAEASVQSLKDAEEQARQAKIQQTRDYNEYIAAAKTAAAAEKELAAAAAEEESALKSNISTRMAANAELKIFEGNLGGSNRAAGALLSTIPGLGEAMQLAFPIFGAIALVQVLGTLAEKVAAIARGFDAVAQAEDKAAREAAGVTTALESAVRNSAEVTRKLIEDTQGKTGLLKYDLEHMKLKVNSDDLTIIDQAQAKVDELNRRIAAGTKQRHIPGLSNAEAGVEESDDAKAAEKLLPNAQDSLLAAKIQRGADQGDAEHLQHEIDKPGKEDSKKEAEEQYRADEEDRNLEKQKGATDETQRGLLAANADRDYWQARIQNYQQGSSQYKAIQQKVAEDEIAIEKAQAAFKRSQMADAVATQNLSPEAANKGIAEFNKLNAEAAERAQRAQERLNQEYAKASEIASKATAAAQLQNIAYQESSGRITKLSADMQAAKIHASEYAEEIKALERVLAALRKDGEGLESTSAEGKDNQAKQQQVKNQISQLQAQGVASAGKDASVIKTDIAKPYLDAYNEIETSFMRMQSSMLTGHKTFGQAMRKEEQDLAMYAIQQAEKWLFGKLRVYAVDAAEYLVHLATKKTADATAAAVQVTTATTASTTAAGASVASNVAQIESLAAVAAAAAFASTAAIPVVGLAIAPEASAGAYATVAAMGAMAAFETGTSYVPRTGVAVIHEGEQVVNRRNNDELMSLARSGAGKQQGGGHTFNNTMNYHSHGGGNKTDARHASKMMHKQVLRAHAVMS